MRPVFLTEAIRLATLYHHSQSDKQGQPYILHPLRVMQAVRQRGINAMAAAVLHDVVEDTPYSLEALSSDGYPDQVIALVDALTRIKGESYTEFIARIMAAGPDAIAIKVADICDNLSRPLLGEEWQGLRERYIHALETLRGATGDPYKIYCMEGKL